MVYLHTEDRYDYLEFYDGWDTSASLIRSLDSELGSAGVNVTSTDRYITLYFYTDGRDTSKGFHLTYWMFCKCYPTYLILLYLSCVTCVRFADQYSW